MIVPCIQILSKLIQIVPQYNKTFILWISWPWLILTLELDPDSDIDLDPKLDSETNADIYSNP